LLTTELPLSTLIVVGQGISTDACTGSNWVRKQRIGMAALDE
jgi:hypothetical protein